MKSYFKIIGKYKWKKTFETPEDFNKFYNKHKEKINESVEQGVKIKDFKITKRNMRIVEGKKVGDLHLKPPEMRTEDDLRRDLEIEDKIGELKDDI